MSVTWTNIYSDADGADHFSPSMAHAFASLEKGFIRVEQRWNGHWLRPPVGMRADQASHQLIRKFYTCKGIPLGLGPWELEPRSRTVVLRFEGEDLEMS